MQESINRNILECKLKYFCCIPEGADVLIETYWNVNLTVNSLRLAFATVLIETYWNVNIGWMR